MMYTIEKYKHIEKNIVVIYKRIEKINATIINIRRDI